ncbi:MAG: response regulator [Myxococcales bacterium]|nr:response regulator [Myxococcales bacterium]
MESLEKNRLLLIEDDNKLAQVVREYLETNGFRVQIEGRGDRAVQRIIDENPDLVILDIMLPGKDGLTVCREVRPHYHGPVLMLTARGEETDEIVGLEVGADDYMAKPVRPRLLLSRLQALLRRAAATPITSTDPAAVFGEVSMIPQRIEIGTLIVDAGNRVVHHHGEPVEMTTSEFDLLWLLARHAGQILTREHIYTRLRGIDYDGLDRSIDLRIARLRKKLGDDGKLPQLIKSVRGVGYLLVKDP